MEENKIFENNVVNIKKNKNRKAFVRVFLYQSLLSLFIVLFLFCFRFLFPSLYFKASENALVPIKNFNFRIFVNDTISNLKEFFGNVKAVDLNCCDEKKESKENNKEKDDSDSKEKETKKSDEKSDDDKEVLKPYYEGEKLNYIIDRDDDDVIFFNFMKPLKGSVSSHYGKRQNPLTKKQEKDFHHGVDISVCDGTPIYSIFDGVVQKVASSERSGNYVFVKHGEFYESLYAHCSKILVSKGDLVKKGQKIALSGHSGNVTGAHLHLGIKRNGHWIDPVEVLPNLVWLNLKFLGLVSQYLFCFCVWLAGFWFLILIILL